MKVNHTDPISIVISAQQVSARVVGSAAHINDRSYERVDPNDASLMSSSIAMATMTTPRLMDAKEQKRREKEMRRLAKLRIEAELKEAKLQAKLAKKQAKRGEPVALGVLQTHTDGFRIFILFAN